MTAQIPVAVPFRNRPISRFGRIRYGIRYGEHSGRCEISFRQCFEANLGLALRKVQARRCVNSVLRAHARVRWKNDTDAVIPLNIGEVLDAIILDEVTDRLLAVAERPLTPRELLLALPISNRERLRWTKDGRLRKTGSATVRRGHLISIPTYDVVHIELIANSPKMLYEWRAADEYGRI